MRPHDSCVSGGDGCESKLGKPGSAPRDSHQILVTDAAPSGAQLEHALGSLGTPAHPGAFHPLLNDPAAGGLHHTAADVKSGFLEALVAHLERPAWWAARLGCQQAPTLPAPLVVALSADGPTRQLPN